MDLTPNSAILLNEVPGMDSKEYSEETISSTLIHRGDLLKVLPGSRIAADGVLVEGNNVHTDESMITGESLPVLKKIGDGLVGGTLNSGGAFIMRAVREWVRMLQFHRSSSSGERATGKSTDPGVCR